ncbi:PA2779 family protein [Pseudogulbenkiania subflava]|uniref:PA2779 family protein n=1 Tax=Pseudogulbenkiania subflava DSM 22618 TaxID=1123014 RepID=A0A1Y6C2Y3_9NEIS|nr:PA2779 family protein [Pseudogulbenkiania subflava]SMF43004.1 hypothetical protein SAMN02745746_03207 [Pseudogulbenkiania subflava DSM 22618]
MSVSIAKYLGTALLASCLAVQAPLARAGMVSTEQAAAAQQAQQAQADREKVRAFLDRAEVRDKLQALGVQAAFAKDRVDSMTDEEVTTLAQRIDTLSAGGRLSNYDLIVILLIVLIIAVIV